MYMYLHMQMYTKLLRHLYMYIHVAWRLAYITPTFSFILLYMYQFCLSKGKKLPVYWPQVYKTCPKIEKQHEEMGMHVRTCI